MLFLTAHNIVVPQGLGVEEGDACLWQGGGNWSSSLPWVSTAALELCDQPLHERIVQLGDRLFRAGIHQLQVIPLFLSPGVHVMDDIPAAVAIAQAQLAERVTLKLCPYIGRHPDLSQLLATQFTVPHAQRVLVAHGSRRTGSHLPLEQLAGQVAAKICYWTVSPSLETTVTQAIHQGCTHLEILPYFLFPGTTTDAIARQIADLSNQFPKISLQITPPLGANSALARMIVDLVTL
jgi:sirohydrochlorin ferrochelatase